MWRAIRNFFLGIRLWYLQHRKIKVRLKMEESEAVIRAGTYILQVANCVDPDLDNACERIDRALDKRIAKIEKTQEKMDS